MIISTEQIKRRLRMMNISVGDILIDFKAPGSIEIYGRADNHAACVFTAWRPDDFEKMISDANLFFRAMPASEAPVVEYVMQDGRKIPI
jgi:hypothetical protein